MYIISTLACCGVLEHALTLLFSLPATFHAITSKCVYIQGVSSTWGKIDVDVPHAGISIRSFVM